MTCSLCTEASQIEPKVAKKNSFVGEGTCTLKFETVKSHERSNNHLLAKNVMKAKKDPSGSGTVIHIIKNLTKAHSEKLSILFRTCHGIAATNRPFSDYVAICELDKAKGLDIGDTYVNEKAAKVFTEFIAKVETNDLAEDIKGTSFISVISDGSTDSSVQEQEMFFVR